jgi:hypothetical protein
MLHHLDASPRHAVRLYVGDLIRGPVAATRDAIRLLKRVRHCAQHAIAEFENGFGGLDKGRKRVAPILPSLPMMTVLALFLKIATTVTDLEGSATLGKFTFGALAGVTVTSSPIVSSSVVPYTRAPRTR